MEVLEPVNREAVTKKRVENNLTPTLRLHLFSRQHRYYDADSISRRRFISRRYNGETHDRTNADYASNTLSCIRLQFGGRFSTVNNQCNSWIYLSMEAKVNLVITTRTTRCNAEVAWSTQESLPDKKLQIGPANGEHHLRPPLQGAMNAASGWPIK